MTDVYNDLDHFFGRWSEEEFNQIRGTIDSERKIDRELWVGVNFPKVARIRTSPEFSKFVRSLFSKEE